MPNWLKVAAGLALAVSLIAVAALRAYSGMLGPLVQAHGTTYYNGTYTPAQIACKPESTIVASIDQVHAKFDYYVGPDLVAFERRALIFDGLPPLKVEKLYVITQDDKLRDGEMVLFIGLKADCVSIVFGFPARVYYDIIGKSQS
ncbi:MAG: hypothetical protein MUO41_05425 [Methyloceanibacter sp.]|jgi:hypothetical protein|nr:hypothetical protein [Methyloceanibacter sp.]